MYCKGCGYNLRRLDRHRCPECRRPFVPSNPSTWRRSLDRVFGPLPFVTIAALFALAGSAFVPMWAIWSYNAWEGVGRTGTLPQAMKAWFDQVPGSGVRVEVFVVNNAVVAAGAIALGAAVGWAVIAYYRWWIAPPPFRRLPEFVPPRGPSDG